MGEWLRVPQRDITTARHAAPEAAAELEQFTLLAERCGRMAARLTDWISDAEFIGMLVHGYHRDGIHNYPEGADAPSEVINQLRNTRDALVAAAAMMTDG